MYYVELLSSPNLTQRDYSPVGYAHLSIRNDLIHIHILYHAKSLTMRAITLRRVKRERMWGRFQKRYARHRIYQMLGVMVQLSGLHVQNAYASLSHIESELDRIANSRHVRIGRFHLIYHELYEVGLVPI